MILVLVGSVACLAALSATFVAVLVLRRLRLARREAAQGATAERLLPTALALLSGDIAIADLPVGGTEVLGRLLLRFSRQLAGEGRLEIASFFEESGGVDRELAALAHRRPWRRATAAFTFVRVAAANALGAVGDAAVAGPLLRVAGTSSFAAARAAASALTRVDPQMLAAAEDAGATSARGE